MNQRVRICDRFVHGISKSVCLLLTNDMASLETNLDHPSALLFVMTARTWFVIFPTLDIKHVCVAGSLLILEFVHSSTLTRQGTVYFVVEMETRLATIKVGLQRPAGEDNKLLRLSETSCRNQRTLDFDQTYAMINLSARNDSSA